MYESSIHRSELVGVAMRSVTMDDIAQSVLHLSNHIISTLSKTSPPDLKDYSTSTSEAGTSDVFEGTLGFVNHTKFLQNLCGGARSWKRRDQSSPPWSFARISSPPAAKHEKLNRISNNQNVVAVKEAERFWTVEAKSEAGIRDENRLQLEGSPSTEISRYGNLSDTVLEPPFHTEEVSSGAAVSKEDLGRSTWTFLHTLAAQFPEHPTKQQQRDAKDLMGILSRIYPCKECADHFKDVLKAHPVEAKSGDQLAQWMCRVHNVVNRSLGKAQFPCHRVDLRWGALDCNEGACDLQGRLYRCLDLVKRVGPHVNMF